MTALAPGRIENHRHPASFSERPHLADELVARHSEGLSVENVRWASVHKLAHSLASTQQPFHAQHESSPTSSTAAGPPGSCGVLDDQTIGFADFAGNRQYITQGNLEENPKAHLFLIAKRRRIKTWGTARVVESDDALVRRLMPMDYRARPEQALLFTVTAWDVNCPQHIPQRFEAADVAAALESRDRRIAALEAEVRRLREDSTA